MCEERDGEVERQAGEEGKEAVKERMMAKGMWVGGKEGMMAF